MTRAWRAPSLLFTAYALLIFLPNLVLLYRDPGLIPFVRGIVVSGLLFATVFSIFRKYLWFGCLIFLPFAVLAPAEAFYILRYDRPSDANILATVFESNLRETSEYLGPIKIYLLVAIGLAAALSLVTILALWNRPPVWKHRSANWVAATALGVPLLTVLIALAHRSANSSNVGDTIGEALGKLKLETYATYPFGVIDRFIEYRHEWRAMQSASNSLAGFKFGAHSRVTVEDRQIFVLVIGEASRRDHWSLFGYERPTNPELSRTANLITIPDMISPWAASRWAVPTIVTRRPAEDWNVYYNEPSISRVFREAGFQTYWYSTQAAVGQYDSPISVEAFDASHVKFLSPLGYVDEDIHDDALLGPLQETIDSTRGNLFIVLHTMGSHGQYTSRYPKTFDRFVPSSDGGRPVAANEAYRNAYDNSVLFTDHMLTSIIGILDHPRTISAMFYVSDHGEMLPDENCSVLGHGFPGLPVYPVPALFWYSSGYARQFTERIAALKATSSQPASTANVFESLVDMADLDFPGHDVRRSMFDPRFMPQRRIVHAETAVDFDHKIVLPKCQVVAPAPSEQPQDSLHR